MWLDQHYFHNRTKKYNILELNTHEVFQFLTHNRQQIIKEITIQYSLMILIYSDK